MKYFNFLLENDINFKIDETGNYTALVKVFNPEYYKNKENSNSNQDYNYFYLDKNNSKSEQRHYRSASSTGSTGIINTPNNNFQATLKSENYNNINKKVNI